MQVKELNKYNVSELEEIIILSKKISKDKKGLFKMKPFKNLPYGKVLEIKKHITNGNTLNIELIQKLSEICNKKMSIFEINNSDVSQLFRTINEIEYNFEEIAKYEAMLSGSTDADLENAGISELNQFGDLNTIDTLAGGDMLKWDLILEKEWWDVFNKLLKDKIERDIQKRYSIIQQNKSK